jgi:phosphoglucosamine mutase
VVDGDAILAILALALRERGALAGDAVAVTVMTNLGFHRAMAAHGVRVVETPVGDRHVLARMRAERLSLGGEQSGHVILLDHANTGDGVLTGLHLLARVAETGKPLGELAAVMRRLPQVLVNVKGVDKSRVHSATRISEAVSAAETELGESGRVLLRPSGTEPMVRVMVEAESHDLAESIAHRLAGVVREELS